jgi:DNA polymerase-3 subunit beta
MNIKINRDVLLKPLSNVSGIVEKRHALPILSNLLLEGTVNNQLKFSATDLEGTNIVKHTNRNTK